MATSRDLTSDDGAETVYEEYVLGVRVVQVVPRDGDEPRYRFEAPDHVGVTFDDAEMATLYADVYFDANGFVEDDTGERGIPPAIVQAGRDTLVAYMLTRRGVDVHWLASFYGEKPEKIQRYVSRVRKRADQIRAGARERGMT